MWEKFVVVELKKSRSDPSWKNIICNGWVETVKFSRR